MQVPSLGDGLLDEDGAPDGTRETDGATEGTTLG